MSDVITKGLPIGDRWVILKDGSGDPNAPRLIAAIEGAWKKLPPNLAKSIADYWREKREKEHVLAPSFSLLPNLDDFGSHRVAAQNLGWSFCFSSTYITDMPDELLLAVVGHELIHALRWIDGSRLKDGKAEEKIVMRLTQELGFDQEGLLSWFGRRQLSEQ